MREFITLTHPQEGQKCPSYSIWLQFVLQDTDYGVEMLSPMPEPVGGEKTTWLEYWSDGSGIESLLGEGHASSFNGNWVFRSGLFQLATEYGIAPEQPFCVRLWYDSWQDYWGEYDERVDWEITHITPLDPLVATERIAKYIAYAKECVYAREKRERQLHHDRHSIVDSLYVKWDYYFANSYCDGVPPDGLMLRLCTTVGGHQDMFHARSDSGDREEVISKMRVHIALRYPTVNFEELLKKQRYS